MACSSFRNQSVNSENEKETQIAQAWFFKATATLTAIRGEMTMDATLAYAILDRLLHNSH